ncbi:MAG: hypothetical protein K0R29_1681 [Pseudobdellovibrio sp.]|nr:hypothetical protein [Pseudobdellovibrio sp.]
MPKIFQVFFFVFLLNLHNAQAADAAAAKPTTKPATKPATKPVAQQPDKIIDVTPALQAEKPAEKPPEKPVEKTPERPTERPTEKSKEILTGVNGLFIGGALYSQIFSTTAKANIDGTARDIKSKSSNYQNLGVSMQYMQMPFDNFGSYFTGTLATTMNFGSANYSTIMTLNFQANAAYAKQAADKTPYYFFAGVGYELLSGKDIVDLVEPGGLTVQAGTGMILYKNYGLEAFYQITRHNVASAYTDQLRTYLQAQGATTVTFDPSVSTSNVLALRVSYKF